MACGTNNIWTKIIASFTIIFCLAYVALDLSILTIYHTEEDDSETPDYFKEINNYTHHSKPKTLGLLYTSMVFDLLWTLTSVLLLIYLWINESNDYSIKGTQKLIKVYFSWIVVAFLSFIPDVVAMFIHGLAFGGFDEEDLSEKIKKEGSLYLLLLSSRFGVLLLHIGSWIGMIIITNSLQKSLIEDDSKSSNKRIVPLKPPKPALKPSKVPHLEETNVDRVRDWYKHYEGDDESEEDNPNHDYNPNNNNNPNNYYSEPDVVPQYIPRLNGNTNPAFVGNQNYRPVRKPPPPPPPKPYTPSSNTNVMVNGVPSGTLRRQLPWSYMPESGSEVPQLPKNRGASPGSSNASAFTAVRPYVPAPDYNNKPVKTERRELGHPAWSQYL